MAENGENEAKPQVEQHIQIKVRSQDGNEVVFKVKRTTPFRKVMTAYCDRMSQNVANLVFLFDGQRIREDQAPGELEMEDGDTVDAMIHQEGGCGGRGIGL